jgi:hypothetical protein
MCALNLACARAKLHTMPSVTRPPSSTAFAYQPTCTKGSSQKGPTKLHLTGINEDLGLWRDALFE